MILETTRFGRVEIAPEATFTFPNGVLGFPQLKSFCLIDPADGTSILWLQSTEDREVAFAVVEPKIFHHAYRVQLCAADRRELGMDDGADEHGVFNILTIPENASAMTVNLKAPIVINLKNKIAKQVVLQENEYQIKHAAFEPLKKHLATLPVGSVSTPEKRAPLRVREIPAFPAL